MKEELKDLTKKVKEQGLAFVDAISDVNKLLRQQTETAKEEISFTRLELKELLNSFYDSVVDQAATNDVSHYLIDISFDLDYDHRITLYEAYLSREFLDFDVNEFLVEAIREKNKKQEGNDAVNNAANDAVKQSQCQ